MPEAELDEHLAEVLAGFRKASRPALAQTKKLMRRSGRLLLGEALDDEAASIASVISGPDGVEGVDAFLAKRAPRPVRLS